jgi:hypothetical protein
MHQSDVEVKVSLSTPRTHIGVHTSLAFREGYVSRTLAKSVTANNWSPPNRRVFQDCLSVKWAVSCCPSSPWTSYGLARSCQKKFDAPSHWRVRVMYFIPGATPLICETAKYEPSKSVYIDFYVIWRRCFNYGTWTWRWRTLGEIHTYVDISEEAVVV